MRETHERPAPSATDGVPAERAALQLEGFPTELLGSAPGVQASGLIFTSGLLATDYATGIAAEARPHPGRPYEAAPVRLQTRHIFTSLRKLLEGAGSSLADLVRLDQFCIGRESAAQYIEGRNEFLLTDRPASVLVGVERHPVPSALIALDGIAAAPVPGIHRSTANSKEVTYNTAGGYSQAVTVGDFVFIAGSVASDLVGAGPYPSAAGTGLAPEARIKLNYWYGSEIKAQTRYVMHDKLKPMLEAGGSSLENVVHAEVYLSDVAADWAGFIEAWKEIYPDASPAMTLFPVSTFGAIGARIEICLVGVKDAGATRPETASDGELPPLGPCAAATRAGNFLFFSTQIASDESGVVAAAAANRGFPHHESAAARELEVILSNVEAICSREGTRLDDLVRARIMVRDLADLASLMTVWRDAVRHDPPAVTVLGVNGPFPASGCSVALDVIAHAPRSASTPAKSA